MDPRSIPQPRSTAAPGGRPGSFAEGAYDETVIDEVIRPAAIVPEEAARTILVELSLTDVRAGGLWLSEPARWARYDRPWAGSTDPGGAELVGTMQIAYGTPTKYEITIYRVSITRYGAQQGWTVANLSDEALGFADLTLDRLPRVAMSAPPRPLRF